MFFPVNSFYFFILINIIKPFVDIFYIMMLTIKMSVVSTLKIKI